MTKVTVPTRFWQRPVVRHLVGETVAVIFALKVAVDCKLQ